MPTDPPPESVGQRLRQLRQARGLSQELLSQRCGFSVATIGMYERGCRRLRGPALLAVAEALAVSPHTLLDQAPIAQERLLACVCYALQQGQLTLVEAIDLGRFLGFEPAKLQALFAPFTAPSGAAHAPPASCRRRRDAGRTAAWP